VKRFILIVWFLLLAPSALQAGYQEGMAAHEAGDYVTALREWRPLAEGGDAMAQNALGVMYQDGLGVEKNDVTAAKWFRKAAQGGDAKAQWNLGIDYYLGRGVEQDFAEAHEWFSRAGDGLPPGDAREEAKKYKSLTYKLSLQVEAAEAGNALVQTLLGVIFAQTHGALKTIQKQPNGSDLPLSKANRKHSIISAGCMWEATGCRRTLRRQRSGIFWPQIITMRKRENGSGRQRMIAPQPCYKQ